MTDRGRAAWTLALLSPVIAELLSGSSPPLEFFFPPSFVGLLGMYGAGVLIVRELTVRWGKGWATIILLGAAYGVIEEGLAVKSFFDPAWMDLADLATYGRYWSTNWVWAFWLTVFHSTISICLPIIISQTAHPQFNREPLLTDRQLRVVLVLFAADIIIFAALFAAEYVPPAAQYLLAMGATALLVVAARRAPSDLVSPIRVRSSWSLRKSFLLGAAMIWACFLISSGPFLRGFHPTVTMAALLVVCAGTVLLLQHKVGRSDGAAHKAYFGAGLLTLFVVFGVILEAQGVLGMSLCSVFSVMLIVDITRKARGKRPIILFRSGPHAAGGA